MPLKLEMLKEFTIATVETDFKLGKPLEFKATVYIKERPPEDNTKELLSNVESSYTIKTKAGFAYNLAITN